ncbi:MAG TPA: LysR family transcriptional regulator [Candidatus Acidoferrales bacterium]
MDLEIRHLRLVQAIADRGSMTRAGQFLNLTQSALSHQLRDIESRLGTPLFWRVNRRMVLTPAGQRLLDSARGLLGELERTEAEIRRIGQGQQGVLRLATQCNTCFQWLPARLKLFYREFPRVDVQVVAEATHRPVPYLLRGRLDLAVLTGPVRHPQLDVRPLFEDEMRVVVRPDHPLAGREFVTAQDFAGENLFTYSRDTEDNYTFRHVLNPAGVRPAQVSAVPLTEAIVEMVKAGLGIGVMATWAVAREVNAGSVRALPLTRHGLRRTWHAATLKTKQAPAHLGGFIELLRKYPPTVCLPEVCVPLRARRTGETRAAKSRVTPQKPQRKIKRRAS